MKFKHYSTNVLTWLSLYVSAGGSGTVKFTVRVPTVTIDSQGTCKQVMGHFKSNIFFWSYFQ